MSDNELKSREYLESLGLDPEPYIYFIERGCRLVSLPEFDTFNVRLSGLEHFKVLAERQNNEFSMVSIFPDEQKKRDKAHFHIFNQEGGASLSVYFEAYEIEMMTQEPDNLVFKTALDMIKKYGFGRLMDEYTF